MADAFRAFIARTELYFEDQNVNDRHKQDQNVNDRHKQDQNVKEGHKQDQNVNDRHKQDQNVKEGHKQDQNVNDRHKQDQNVNDRHKQDQNVKEGHKQAIKIKIAIGDEGMRRILASGLSDDEKKDPNAVWVLIEEQVDATVKINVRVHRLEFAHMRQKAEENITDFVSRLREKAIKCKFENNELNERLIEMIIVSTPVKYLRKELLSNLKGT